MVASAVAAPGRGRVRVRAGGRARQGAAANGDSARAATARCGASHGQRRPPRLNRGPSRFNYPLPRFLSHHLILSLGGCACRPPSPLVSTCAGGRACFRPQPRPSLSLWERMPPASARLFGVTVSVFMLTEPIWLRALPTGVCPLIWWTNASVLSSLCDPACAVWEEGTECLEGALLSWQCFNCSRAMMEYCVSRLCPPSGLAEFWLVVRVCFCRDQ